MLGIAGQGLRKAGLLLLAILVTFVIFVLLMIPVGWMVWLVLQYAAKQ